MVLAELIGLACAIVVGALVFKNSAIYQMFQAQLVTKPKHDSVGMKSQESVDFHFKLNHVFELQFKSRSNARIVQYSIVIVLMAIAFLIVTIGLRNLGIG